MASLTVDSGSMAGSRIDLASDVLVLGRQDGCDVVIRDDTVSRQHARVVRTADGYYVEDLNSRNGTYLNGKRVLGRAPLRDGDCVQLYDVVVTFRDGEGAQSESRRSGGSVWLTQDGLDPRTTEMLLGATVAEIDLRSPDRTWADERADVRLQAVLDVSRQLGNWLDPDQLYARILDGLLTIFPQVERACLLRLDQPGGQLMLDAVRSRGGSDPCTVGPIMQTIVKQCFSHGKALLTVDAATSGDAASSASIHAVEPRCVMCAPLLDSLRSPMGAIYLDTTDDARPFTPSDLDVLACVAMLASQAVEQATLHNARYRAVVDLSADAIITCGADGGIESFNPAACDLFGYDGCALREASIIDLLPELAPLVSANESQAAAILGAFRRAAESSGRRRDGSEFPIRLSIGELRLEGQTLYTTTVHDITEQKRVEESLKQLNDHLEREVQRRTSYVQLHQDVATIANEAETVSQAFRAALDRVREATGWPVGHVFVQSEDEAGDYVDSGIWSLAREIDPSPLVEESRRLRVSAGRTPIGRVIETRQAYRGAGPGAASGDRRSAALQALGLHVVFAFPVFVGEEVAAVMEFFAPRADEPDENLLTVMVHVGTQLGRVIERRRMQQELVDAVWDQQREFGQELHDTVGQELTGIGMLADSLARKLAARGAAEADAVRELAGMIQQAKQGARRLAKGLLPVEVDAEGLKAALEELAEATQQRCGIAVDVSLEECLPLDDNKVATHLFRIAQEAVTNAVRHAGARRLQLRLKRSRRGGVELSVADDGRGMPSGGRRPGRGVGLQIMQYRAQVIDAELNIHSGVDGGTVVVCRLPRSTNHAIRTERRTRQCAHR